jgi:hypothetical protein
MDCTNSTGNTEMCIVVVNLQNHIYIYNVSIHGASGGIYCIPGECSWVKVH